MDDYLIQVVMSVIDDSQYGAIPNLSTTMALISMLDDWSLGTDGNGATVRTILSLYMYHLVHHTSTMFILLPKIFREKDHSI